MSGLRARDVDERVLRCVRVVDVFGLLWEARVRSTGRGRKGRRVVVVVVIRFGFRWGCGGLAWGVAQSEVGMWIVAIVLGLVAVLLARRAIE